MSEQKIAYPYSVNEEVVAEFQSKGFVVTDDVFASSTLERYSRAVDAEVELRTAADFRDVAEKSTYEQSFIQCMRLWETSDVVRELSCSSVLAGIGAQLLGVEGLHLWHRYCLRVLSDSKVDR